MQCGPDTGIGVKNTDPRNIPCKGLVGRSNKPKLINEGLQAFTTHRIKLYSASSRMEIFFKTDFRMVKLIHLMRCL